MDDAWPQTLLPRRAGESTLVLRGELAQNRLARLGTAFVVQQPVQVSLRFSQEGNERVWLTGHIGATVQATCQRCLEPLTQKLEATVEVGFGTPAEDEASEILQGLDEPFSLVDFIEDELLLAAPMINLHDGGTCVPAPATSGSANPQAPEARKPFSALEGLVASGQLKPKTGD